MNQNPPIDIPGAREDMLITIPVEDLDITPGRGMYLIEYGDGEKTAGGIIVPEQAQGGQLARWRITAVGPSMLTDDGEKVDPLYVEDDEVWISPQAGTMFDIPNTTPKLVLLTETAIIAKVKVRAQ